MKRVYRQRNDWKALLGSISDRLENGEQVSVEVESFSDYAGLRLAAEKIGVAASKRGNEVLLRVGKIKFNTTGLVRKSPEEKFSELKKETVDRLWEMLDQKYAEMVKCFEPESFDPAKADEARLECIRITAVMVKKGHVSRDKLAWNMSEEETKAHIESFENKGGVKGLKTVKEKAEFLAFAQDMEEHRSYIEGEEA